MQLRPEFQTLNSAHSNDLRGMWERDSAADKLGRRSEKEMLLSMTLLLLLTASHKPPLSDTRLGLKQPLQSHLRK